PTAPTAPTAEPDPHALTPASAPAPLPRTPEVESLMHTHPAFLKTLSDVPTLVFALAAEDSEIEVGRQVPAHAPSSDAEPKLEKTSAVAPQSSWVFASQEVNAPAPAHQSSEHSITGTFSLSSLSLDGVLFAGRYRLEALIGVGGMGSVYRARDQELEERVALKCLRRDRLDQPGVLTRFRQEVKLARRVTHRNIARMFDLGEHDGEKFLTMEYIEGETLTALQRRQRQLPVRQVLQLGQGICEGLAAAHAVGVLHRDLKPDNVMVQADGRVVITDFGIAWPLLEAGPVELGDTRSGTPTYMAPEQVEKQPLSHQTDLYALGELLYQLLTGVPPWTASNLGGLLMKRLSAPAPDPLMLRPELPQGLSQLIQQLMALQPEKRPNSAQEVQARLRVLESQLDRAEVGEREDVGPVGRAPTLQELAARAHEQEGRQTPLQRSLAVLPLRNQGHSEDAYLAEGLTEDLVDSLSMVPELRVLARHLTRGLSELHKEPLALGRALGAQAVLDGSLRRMGEHFRLSLRLISTVDGIQFWARRYDVPGGALLVSSEQVAQEVTRRLQGTQQPTVRQAVTDPKAVELYLKARQYYQGAWSDIVLKSQALFEQAHELAPEDPLLMAGYALSLARQFAVQHGRPGDSALCRTLAERALQQAPNLAEAHMALAWLNLNQGRHFDCGVCLHRAIQAAPALSDGYDMAGQLLLELGDVEQGTAFLHTCMTLEPRMAHARRHLARIISMQGRVDEAIGILQAMLESPETLSAAAMSLARVLLWHGRRVEAQQYLGELSGRTFAVKVRVMGILEAASGLSVDQHLQSLEQHLAAKPESYRVEAFLHQLCIELYLASGQVEQAAIHLEALNEALCIDLFWLEHCPLLAPLRWRARYASIRADFSLRVAAFLKGLHTPD
ncbi:MAG: protein kinase domain-containing protein, partial [Myxococcota bacterium]